MTDRERMDAINTYGTLDEVLADGRMTITSSDAQQKIRIRELLGWCQSMGRSTNSLTSTEIQMFTID